MPRMFCNYCSRTALYLAVQSTMNKITAVTMFDMVQRSRMILPVFAFDVLSFCSLRRRPF